MITQRAKRYPYSMRNCTKPIVPARFRHFKKMGLFSPSRFALKPVNWPPQALYAALLALLTLACSQPPKANFLLITVDTLRADHLGFHGSEPSPSPYLDALAEQSTVFERGVAASSRTVPSHASIMTSRWVRNHSVGANNGGTRLDETTGTLARRFLDSGWETAAFISNAVLKKRVGLDAGFNTYDDKLEQHESNRTHVAERSADRTTDDAIQWLSGHNAKPFFLWVHYNDPHGPYEPRDEYDLFELPHTPEERALPALGTQLGHNGIPAYQAVYPHGIPSKYRSRYLGEIRSVDAEIQRLISHAESVTDSRELIILFTADHGESMGEEEIYFSHGHGTTPDVAHVPFLLKAPGISPQRRSELVHHVDILPTFLELAGIEPPANAQGVPLGPILRAESALPRRPVFTDIGHQVSVYRDNLLLRFNLGRKVGKVERGSRQVFSWEAGSTHLQVHLPKELVLDLETYLAQKPEVQTIEVDSRQKELLRALGYLPPRKQASGASQSRPPQSPSTSRATPEAQRRSIR